jgi:hypothetical protein
MRRKYNHKLSRVIVELYKIYGSKGEDVCVLNYTSRHEDAWSSGGNAPGILNGDTRFRLSAVSFTPRYPSTNPQLSDSNKNQVESRRWVLDTKTD